MSKAKVPNTDDLIALICKAATEKFGQDKVRPGIQIAHIPAVKVADCYVGNELQAEGAKALGLEHGDPIMAAAKFYVALHRYPNQTRECPNPIVAARLRENPFRKVVFTAEHEDLDRAVQLLALQMLPVEAQAELAAAIKGLK